MGRVAHDPSSACRSAVRGPRDDLSGHGLPTLRCIRLQLCVAYQDAAANGSGGQYPHRTWSEGGLSCARAPIPTAIFRNKAGVGRTVQTLDRRMQRSLFSVAGAVVYPIAGEKNRCLTSIKTLVESGHQKLPHWGRVFPAMEGIVALFRANVFASPIDFSGQVTPIFPIRGTISAPMLHRIRDR